MSKAGGIKVRQYMLHNILDHVDPLTGEVNATGLAEDAAQHFNSYGKPPDYEIPEVYFEWAEDIATAHEVKTGVREPRITSALSGLINSRESDCF